MSITLDLKLKKADKVYYEGVSTFHKTNAVENIGYGLCRRKILLE